MNKESAIELCNYLRIEITQEDNRKGELRCLCPFHEDRMSSFGISWEKQLWNCFAGCGAGTIFKLIKKIKKVDILTINKLLKKFGVENSILSVFPSYKKLKAKEDIDEDLDESILDDFSSKPVKYFKNRGFSIFEWMDWKLRFNKKNNSIVFPVYNENNLLIGWTERFIKSKYGNRYAQFLPKKIAMYGLNKLKKTKNILIVEGNLDTIRAYSLLASYKIKCDVIGLIGLGINKYKARFIKVNYDNAIIMMDNDEEGIQGKEFVKKALKGINFSIFQYHENSMKIDICEISEKYFVKEIINCLHRNSKRLGFY